MNFFSSAFAAAKVDVTDIRYWSFPEYTRVVISLTDQVEYNKIASLTPTDCILI
jgi:hypothetical protein